MGPNQPLGPFPKDPETQGSFSAFHYSYVNKAGIKIARHWLCYSMVLKKVYCHFCWLFTDRHSKFYSSAWVNGISARSNISQNIVEHENSKQHINSALAYNYWLQKGTINLQLKSEINNQIFFW